MSTPNDEQACDPPHGHAFEPQGTECLLCGAPAAGVSVSRREEELEAALRKINNDANLLAVLGFGVYTRNIARRITTECARVLAGSHTETQT